MPVRHSFQVRELRQPPTAETEIKLTAALQAVQPVGGLRCPQVSSGVLRCPQPLVPAAGEAPACRSTFGCNVEDLSKACVCWSHGGVLEDWSREALNV